MRLALLWSAALSMAPTSLGFFSPDIHQNNILSPTFGKLCQPSFSQDQNELPKFHPATPPQNKKNKGSPLQMGRNSFEFDEDYYFTLNVTRKAEKSEIKNNYRILAREFHPDRFVEEMKFRPENLSASKLKTYLRSQRVNVPDSVMDKSELVEMALTTFKRTQNVDEDLLKKRTEIMDRFALLNEAYSTLQDDSLRRMYDISGEWGIPSKYSNKEQRKKAVKVKRDTSMGDRAEAARVRARREALQRDSLQERVYRRYMAEQEEKKREEAITAKERQERREKEREERRLERERLGLKSEEEMTDEELRVYNQEKIKAMWGNIFSNMAGAMGMKKVE